MRIALALCVLLATGCSAMLPSSRESSAGSAAAWSSYADAERTFAGIVPGKTTLAELRALGLDPAANSNLTPLQPHEVRERFLVNSTLTLEDLDAGVRECLAAPRACRGWEVQQAASERKRVGNALLDFLRIYRETRTTGWRFSGLLLVKDDVVVYKLAGGEPRILALAEERDPLGPLQALTTRLVKNGIESRLENRGGGSESPAGPPAPTDVMTAVKIRR